MRFLRFFFLTALLGCGSGELACLEADRRETLRAVVEAHAPELSRRARARLFEASGRAECQRGVDAFLVLALAERESRFDPSARGPSGGLGLLQVRASTGKATARRLGLSWRGEAALHDIETNVALGAAYLAHLYQQFGNWEAALAAYNLGPTRLRRLIREGKPASSPYAREVLARSRELAPNG